METTHETLTDGRMVTRELAEWAASLRFEDLPDDVVEEAGRAFADYLGETLFVGSETAWGRAIAEFCAHDGGGRPDATIIASGKKATASRAAMANGMMALGFEYADFGLGGRPYPFAVTAPLAMAETRERSGRDLVLGIVIGYEVIGRIFRATRGSFNKAIDPGKLVQTFFYVPSLYGTFGGAAGAASVMGLDAHRTNYALGLAAAFTGGTFQGHEEGAWQRSLNGGMAGERAVTAALMAETGFKATELGLEGIQGFARMYSNGKLDVDELLGDLGDSYSIMRRWTKRYPMNTTLHAPADALLKIMHEQQIDHTDIEEIDAAWQLVEPFLAKHEVTTVVSAQASLPFALAVAAVQKQVTVDSFTDETVADPEVQAMLRRVTAHQDPELFAKVAFSMPGKVTVRLKDGREYTDEVLYPRGNPQNPLSEDEFKAKFMDMAVRVLGDAQSEELYARARDLESAINVAELTPLFSPT